MSRLPAAAALAATLLAALPAAASAAPLRARFVASVEGRQVTTWDMPRHQVRGDCRGVLFRSAHGSETTTFRTKPRRLLAFRANPRAGVQLRYGTWSPFGAAASHLPAEGGVDRTHEQTLELEPGPCGPPAPEPAPVSDCAKRRIAPQVRLEWRGSRVAVRADANALLFSSCPIFSASGVQDADFTDGIDQRYPARDVFDRSQGVVEVLGRKTFTGELTHGTTTTTVTWKLRLRRAR